MTIKEWMRENSSWHATPAELFDACVKATGFTRKAVQNAYYSMIPRPPLGTETISVPTVIHVSPVPETEQSAIQDFTFVDEVQLMEKHNFFYIFESFLKSIPKGKFARETDVLRHLNMSGKPGYRQVVEHPDYKVYRGTADGIVYYGHPESIEKMKQKTTLK